MTLTINLPPDLADALREHAARSGKDVSGFVLEAVQEKLAKAKTFEEICAPFAGAAAAAEIDETEFEQFFDAVRQEAWEERQGKAS
jgi:predicted transcriptional regulator